MDFNCVQDCSKCCIEREYYPSKKFGKIGVLILPEEKRLIENLATDLSLDIEILPRIGVSYQNIEEPEKILAYQLMGKESNGNTCPFLDIGNNKRSPHGGYLCKIYNQRPLACKAFPVIESKPVTLDSKCKFCETCEGSTSNLDQELESLIKIKQMMQTDSLHIWRYATGRGEIGDESEIQKGWVLET